MERFQSCILYNWWIGPRGLFNLHWIIQKPKRKYNSYKEIINDVALLHHLPRNQKDC